MNALIKPALYRFFLCICIPVAANGQGLTGKATGCNDYRPLAGVSVRIKGTGTGMATGSDGRYAFAGLEPKPYTLLFSFTGMKTETRTVDLSAGKDRTLNVCMEDDPVALGEVTVEARHERKELTEARQQGVPVSVIDGKMLAGRGTSISEVINHQTGVKVRRTGGVGSETKINVRGLEGKRVQIYLDGHAINTPDGSFSINDIPLQFIDRIEVYKGIVPPEFGGDGLGGAINVVTVDAEGGYYDAWYSHQSYGVQEGSLLYKHYFPEAQMYSALMIGGGRALNNYTMQSPYIDGLTIRRDHDRFRKLDGARTLEFKDAYFDNFEIENIFFMSDRQIQGIQTNIRHAESSGWLVATTPKLEKQGFLSERLDMKLLGFAGFGANCANDTSSYIYGFDGTRSVNTYRGEVGSVPNLSDDPYQDYRYTLNLKYRLPPSGKR